MMLLSFLICIWITAIAVYLINGHTLIAIFLTICGMYELVAPILYTGVFGEYVVLGQDYFLSIATDDAVNSYLLGLYLFFAIVNLSYFLTSKYFLFANKQSKIEIETSTDVYHVLMFVVFVFGVISVYTRAGSIRFLDYHGESVDASPFFSYGIALLVTAVIITTSHATRRNWISMCIGIAVITPLAYEVFLSSKRQSFAPSLLFLILLVLYSKRIKHKTLSALVIGAGAFAFLSTQFWLRGESVGWYTPAGFFEIVILPQLGEFVAIGSTGFAAWTAYVIGNDPVNWGAHWIFDISNSLPFLKFGNLLFPNYRDNMVDEYLALAPWGGLSMLADAILGLGLGGVVLISTVIGASIRYWHHLLDRYLSDGIVISVNGIYSYALISTIVLKYRSGLGDALQYCVYMSILYFGTVGLGVLHKKLTSSRRIGWLRRQSLVRN